MSKAHLCDNCSARLSEDGEWYVLGLREPSAGISLSLETMLGIRRQEPTFLEFCASACVITYLMVAASNEVSP